MKTYSLSLLSQLDKCWACLQNHHRNYIKSKLLDKYFVTVVSITQSNVGFNYLSKVVWILFFASFPWDFARLVLSFITISNRQFLLDNKQNQWFDSNVPAINASWSCYKLCHLLSHYFCRKDVVQNFQQKYWDIVLTFRTTWNIAMQLWIFPQILHLWQCVRLTESRAMVSLHPSPHPHEMTGAEPTCQIGW